MSICRVGSPAEAQLSSSSSGSRSCRMLLAIPEGQGQNNIKYMDSIGAHVLK